MGIGRTLSKWKVKENRKESNFWEEGRVTCHIQGCHRDLLAAHQAALLFLQAMQQEGAHS